MIEFKSVSKHYGGVAAVRDFSLQIPEGQTLVFVGSSGSGKTTLLRMINRMVEPSTGQVLIGGKDVQATDAVKLRRSIGYVMQHGGLLPHRTVQDNVVTVPRLNGTDKKTARLRALELLERVGLDPQLAKRYPRELSGGQQQRVGVARALAADPQILLMDEPFAAVDPIVRRELQLELMRLQAELGKTVVFVTHDIDEALLLGDTVVVLKNGGEIAQIGTPEQLVSEPADDFVRDFIGFDRSDRRLTTVTRGGVKYVVDATGRPLGLLGEEPSRAASQGQAEGDSRAAAQGQAEGDSRAAQGQARDQLTGEASA